MKLFVVLTIIINLLFCLKIHANEVITVVTEDWPPYSYLLPNNEVSGIATSKVKQILEKANIEYTLSLYPWGRSYEMALTQKNVLIYSIYRHAKREASFQWICPLLPKVKLHFFALAKNKYIQIDNIEDAMKFTVGVARKEIAATLLREKGFTDGKNMYFSVNDDINLQQLLKGKVEVIVSTMPSIKMRLENMSQDFSQVKAFYLEELNVATENCMAFGLRTSGELVEKVRQALKAVNGNS
ncbi:transporter substrate-binding domain-containing protein [Thalassomonas viridans]|uniref:Transporter substrate-binding domain-containing protein n=1 Tax=Thalassomonas viridans TaxID=137584 RepID=A0AAE9Z734_9GAMM|nr:transporter substrate-binding domain-containing protein [Thalassomonas viridans]WDE07986.1 transporter substrate-binding domain-containing protein [Thalassomonas viridans]